MHCPLCDGSRCRYASHTYDTHFSFNCTSELQGPISQRLSISSSSTMTAPSSNPGDTVGRTLSKNHDRNSTLFPSFARSIHSGTSSHNVSFATIGPRCLRCLGVESKRTALSGPLHIYLPLLHAMAPGILLRERDHHAERTSSP